MNLGIGKRININSSIGVVALSSSQLDHQQIEKGQEYLQNLGYKVILSDLVYENEDFFPGNPLARAEELTSMFLDPKIDMILCLRGGFGALQILPYIDYKCISNNPKVFVGYSDVTSLQNTLYQRSGLVTFQGPMLVSNFSQSNHMKMTDDSLFSLLSGEQFCVLETFDILHQPKNIQHINAHILGGNLITFMSLMGTIYQPKIEGSILFFEDIDEKTYSIDRALSQLLLHPEISKVKGFIFGDFNNCLRRNEYELDLWELVHKRLSFLDVPIIYGISSGHCNPMITMPIGASVTIDLLQKTVYLNNKVVQ